VHHLSRLSFGCSTVFVSIPSSLFLSLFVALMDLELVGLGRLGIWFPLSVRRALAGRLRCFGHLIQQCFEFGCCMRTLPGLDFMEGLAGGMSFVAGMNWQLLLVAGDGVFVVPFSSAAPADRLATFIAAVAE
jgi:hypothetical protein